VACGRRKGDGGCPTKTGVGVIMLDRALLATTALKLEVRNLMNQLCCGQSLELLELCTRCLALYRVWRTICVRLTYHDLHFVSDSTASMDAGNVRTAKYWMLALAQKRSHNSKVLSPLEI
jgi:hypothetical protein